MNENFLVSIWKEYVKSVLLKFLPMFILITAIILTCIIANYLINIHEYKKMQTT